MTLPSPRMLNLAALLGCLAAIGGALYLQHGVGLEPCPLCLFQRVAVFAASAVLLLAIFHGPQRVGVRIYAALTGLTALAGAAVAVRHLWLQSLPEEQVPACGPGLDYMMDVLPMQEVLRQVFSGSGECAELDWAFLGISLPGWSLLVFAGLLAVAAVQLLRPLR